MSTKPPNRAPADAEKPWLPYTQMKTAPPPLTAVRTEGCRIQLDDGRWLLDGTSSWWTACHGYNHPHLLQAVHAQLDRMPHVMLGGLVHEPVKVLAQRLAKMTPGDLGYAFFAESGSVAVEVALKMALQYWMAHDQPQRRRFVAFDGGYHGDTLAAMSVCDPEEGMHQRFAGALLQQHVVPLPSVDANGAVESSGTFDRFLARVAKEVAAVIVEPLVQCAGGFRLHPPSVLKAIRAACDRHDVLLIVDEIATGFGRTGTLFACEQAEVVPDIMCLGKALTGGVLPLSATLATERVFTAFLDDDPEAALMHGPTFMGNALACAAANASLDLFEREPRLAQTASIEAQLRTGLERCRSLPGVVDVRTKGAIGVIELDREASPLRPALLEQGLWVRPFGRWLYLMPPLVIEEYDLQKLIDGAATVLS